MLSKRLMVAITILMFAVPGYSNSNAENNIFANNSIGQGSKRIVVADNSHNHNNQNNNNSNQNNYNNNQNDNKSNQNNNNGTR